MQFLIDKHSFPALHYITSMKKCNYLHKNFKRRIAAALCKLTDFDTVVTPTQLCPGLSV